MFYSAGINWLYTAKEEYRYITYRAVVFQAISLILLFVFVKSPLDYFKYALVGIFANVGSNIFNLIYSRKFVDYNKNQRLELKKHIKPIFTFFGITCASKVNNALDAVMLGFMAGDLSVGYYTAAVKLGGMVNELITSVISSLMPRVSYYLEQNFIKEYRLLTEKAFGITFFFSLPATFGLFFLCKPLIIIFTGEKYLPATTTMMVMTFSIIATSTNSYFNNLILTPQHKERYLLYAQIIATVMNFSLNFILIPIYGFFGAAIATLAVEFVFPIVKLFPSWKYINSTKNLITIIKSAFGTGFMFVVLCIFCTGIENNALKITISVFLGSVSYAIIEVVLMNPPALLILNIIKGKFLNKPKKI